MQWTKMTLLLAAVLVSLSIFHLRLRTSDISGRLLHPLLKRFQEPQDPWEGVPEFLLYLRLTSRLRFEQEYKNDLIRTMKLFFPNERARLLVVLDNEKEKDHVLGEKLSKEWPFPQVCYRDPSEIDAYRGSGKARMFWDMMYPDSCTNVTYVGFVDTDTFFSTLVTPELLFDNGKPIIVAKIGHVPYRCWAETTELFLGQKEAMQCMSTFPVMIKTEHMREMREFLAAKHGQDFDWVFRNSASGNWTPCICQFSIMCNYVWYHHRDSYSWRLQMVPNGDWKGTNLLSSQVSLAYYHSNVLPDMLVPIPRSSVHLRYTITNGRLLDRRDPPKDAIEDIIKEGLCYSAGFKVCPERCKRWDRNATHYHLFSFEHYQWFWDKRCKREQDNHYRNVERLVSYYTAMNEEIFGLTSIDQLCNLI